MSGETLRLTPTESVTIRRSKSDLLEVEAVYGPGGKPPPRHFHPSQDEHFEVLEGAVRVRAGEEEGLLAAGETIDIPRGTPHQIWNPENAPARVRWETRPRGRTEEWFRGVDAAQPEGEGKPDPLALAAMLDAYDDTFRLAVGPAVISRGAVRGLGLIARLLGRRPPAQG